MKYGMETWNLFMLKIMDMRMMWNFEVISGNFEVFQNRYMFFECPAQESFQIFCYQPNEWYLVNPSDAGMRLQQATRPKIWKADDDDTNTDTSGTYAQK
jgi:hypothetical protein